MRVIRHLSRLPARLPRVVLTLGNFDGVHRGHRAIVARARDEAARHHGQVVALTFHPHPVAVLAPDRAPLMIQSLHDRLATLRGLGVAVTVAQRFTREFASLDPEAFVERYLMTSLELLHVVVGYDVTFGRGRSGTADTLTTLGARLGFAVDTVGPITAGEEVVSSSSIRRVIATGDVMAAATLLGQRLQLRGRVVRGEQRGRTLGFPTANLHVGPGVLVPANGVYAIWVHGGDGGRPGVLNIGVRPTFGEARRTIEAHVIDWTGDLYGAWLEIELVARLRGEMRFDGPTALRDAIASDVARARAVLGATAA